MSHNPNATKFAPRGGRPIGSNIPSEKNAPATKESMQKLHEALARQAPPPPPVVVAPPKNAVPIEEVTPRDPSGNVLDSAWERIGLPSNFVFYDWNEISVRRFEPLDQAKLARAVRYKNLTLMLDVLASTCNRDVRELATGDFRALCVWHRLNSYMNTTARISWVSRYGNKLDVTIKNTKTKTTPIEGTRAEYLEWKNQGLSIPTVRDLETVEGNEIDEDIMYLFERAQFIDCKTPEMTSHIEKLQEGGDRIASITARIEKMNELCKGTRFELWEKIDEFAMHYSNFGVQEIATVKDDKFEPKAAIEFLRQSEEEEALAEADRIEAELAAGNVPQPKPEEVPLAFSLWNMFCYV